MSRADNLLGLRINHKVDDYVARHLRKYAHQSSFRWIGWHDVHWRTSLVGFSDVCQIDRLYGKCCSTDRHTRAQIEWIMTDTSVYCIEKYEPKLIFEIINYLKPGWFMTGADHYTFRKKIQIRCYVYTHTRFASIKCAASNISNNIVNRISVSRYAFYTIV